MSDTTILELSAVLEDWSFDELCRRHLLDADFVVECVECGISEAMGFSENRPPTQWLFTATAVLRIERARRLQRDLDIELGDMAMLLDLLEEVESLRHEVTTLRKRLSHWEPL
jgi:chaperone modulatory protein CbpM